MADLHLVVKGRERAGKGRGGIAVDKDHIGRKADLRKDKKQKIAVDKNQIR
jgi:hypothetical protein